MCVILISNPNAERITNDMVQKADQANRDGIGAAWYDGQKVCWQKGLTVETAMVLAASLPQPYMLHFRLATIGDVSAQLTHPFPLFGEVSNDLKGSTIHGVMMHNGHWSGWEKEFKKRANNRWVHDYLTNKEEWSDSRGMAWLASRIGYHVLPKIAAQGQKIAVLTRRGITTHGFGWKTLSGGILASNDYFLIDWSQYYTHGRDDWGSDFRGYQGYLYRTRRRKPVCNTTVGDCGTRIPIIEVDEDEAGVAYATINTTPKSKRLADLTEAEWLEREQAIAAEDADWERFRRLKYGWED